MVVVKLRGGLGNQMFQYAAGRRLALQLGTELRLDATAYAAGSNRHYALEPFRIAATLATPRELERWLSTKPSTNYQSQRTGEGRSDVHFGSPRLEVIAEYEGRLSED
jgi:hypothetical protein